MKQLRSLLTSPILSIFCAAFVVRILYNLIVAHGYSPLRYSDSETYQNIAYGLLNNACYCFPYPTEHGLTYLPTTDRAPLWPAVIAVFYGLLADQDRIVRIFLSCVGAATCVLIYYFVKDLFGKRIAIFAGLLAAIYPFLFIYDGWLYTESLYTFFLLAYCSTLYHLQRSPRWQLMVLSGVLLGLLSLTRPNGFALLALFLVWLLIIGWKRLMHWRHVVKSAVIVTLITLVLIAPWTLRNYLVTGSFVPVAIGDGKVFIGAYNDHIIDPTYQDGYYYGIWEHPRNAGIAPVTSVKQLYDQFPANCSGACEVSRDNAYKQYAWEWVQSHLDKMPLLLGLHFINTWQITSQEADLAINHVQLEDTDAAHFVVTMMIVITPIVFGLAALGLVVTRNRWRELLFIYFMIALTVAQCIVFYGIPRFRAPIEPMLIILASGAVWWLVTLLQKPTKEHRRHRLPHEQFLDTTSANDEDALSPRENAHDESLATPLLRIFKQPG